MRNENTHIHEAVPWLYHDVYDIMTLHGLKSVEEYELYEYNSVLIKGIFEHEQSTFQQQ